MAFFSESESEESFFIDQNTYIASNSQEIQIPSCIFRYGISGLESVVKFLRENKQLRFCEIAKILNRNDRTIWDAYSEASKKCHESFDDNSSISIPISAVADRSLSVLESITCYLKDQLNLRFCAIALELNKDQRTVWTVYHRMKKKKHHEANQ